MHKHLAQRCARAKHVSIASTNGSSVAADGGIPAPSTPSAMSPTPTRLTGTCGQRATNLPQSSCTALLDGAQTSTLRAAPPALALHRSSSRHARMVVVLPVPGGPWSKLMGASLWSGHGTAACAAAVTAACCDALSSRDAWDASAAGPRASGSARGLAPRRWYWKRSGSAPRRATQLSYMRISEAKEASNRHSQACPTSSPAVMRAGTTSSISTPSFVRCVTMPRREAGGVSAQGLFHCVMPLLAW
eukprot:133680-Rhodomonas_salina.1